MTVLSRRKVTDGIKTMLASATSRPGDIGHAPDGADMPYWILYPIEGGGFSGPDYYAPDELAVAAYQVSSVGGRVDQAEFMADKVRQAFLARTNGAFVTPITAPAGWKVLDREPYGAMPGADIEQTASPDHPTVVTVPERFLIHLTPA